MSCFIPRAVPSGARRLLSPKLEQLLLLILLIPLLATGSDLNRTSSVIMTIQTYSEWEPGTTRQVRQISVDGKGVGQLVIWKDNRVTDVGFFSYPVNELSKLGSRFTRSFDDAYISTELEDEGLIVEGYPASIKYYFSDRESVKIIDAEPAYSGTPIELLDLAKQLEKYSSTCKSKQLSSQYLNLVPVGRQQSVEINALYKTLPTEQAFRKVISESIWQELRVPARLVPLNGGTKTKIVTFFNEFYEQQREADFYYFRRKSGEVFRVGFY